MDYTKTDITQMRNIIKAIAVSKEGSLRRINALRRASILNRRLQKKESNYGKK